MITAVDTNVLLDVFGADPKFGTPSASALRRCLAEGALVACDAVWAETGAVFPGDSNFIEAMETLGVSFSPLSEAAALKSAAYWRSYRGKGGMRDRVAADFLIGAHACVQCDRLLTRDRGFYREYFRKLKVIDPSA